MPLSRTSLRTSPRIAAFFSWLHRTRVHRQGQGHVIQRHDAILRGTKIEIQGDNSVLFIGPGTRLWECSITLVGDGVTLSIGAGCRLRRSRLNVEDTGSRLLIGAGTSMTGATLVSQEGRLLQIGDDCMIAQNTELRNTDSHAIYAEGTRTNPARDVVIENHVWVSLGACVFKGARVGEGAIIGANAMVTGEIPAGCMAYGIPATAQRTGIRWERGRLDSVSET